MLKFNFYSPDYYKANIQIPETEFSEMDITTYYADNKSFKDRTKSKIKNDIEDEEEENIDEKPT